jgi:hypothetical protein
MFWRKNNVASIIRVEEEAKQETGKKEETIPIYPEKIFGLTRIQ